jgi:pyruvate,orthophosphate dikinase
MDQRVASTVLERERTKWVYRFGDGGAEGHAGMVDALGGKGANLAEMCRLGLPVPPGFTVGTEACRRFYANGRRLPEGLREDVEAALADVGASLGRRFGDTARPLLVSVRSGARASMPGMMDTILNLGLNDATAAALAREAGNERFALDSHRRFIAMYADVALGVDHHHFEDILETAKMRRGVMLDTELDVEDLRGVIAAFRAKVLEETGRPFPEDPHEQLWGAVDAVFGSWMNARAITYRRLHHMSDEAGTAVNVQAMVFGNLGDTSATGVAFTRDPSTGDKVLYGEFLINAQGEDVVAGIRTPQEITEARRVAAKQRAPSMQTALPEAYAALAAIADRLEAHYRDMQDMEFTVENGRLFMLQTRSGKRSARAALKIAVDLAEEGVITREEAVLRVDPASLDQMLHPTLDPNAARDVLTAGLPASPGAASGTIVFTSEAAVAAARGGHAVILVRGETSPEDIAGMHASAGILTTRGGMTSHAAVVARGMGKPCVTGAGSLRIDMAAGTMQVGGRRFAAGDVLTIDGGSGEVCAGKVATREAELTGAFATLMGWADQSRRMRVRANAETPADARAALKYGAEGIGLCRTEHMFFEPARIVVMREMILAETEAGRRNALAKLLPMQRADFEALFSLMAGLPVCIRLLDPPLHEFLPHGEAEMADVAAALGVGPERVRQRADELHEFNPMLGFRGSRLAILYPEIAEMQARAIFEAALAVAGASGRAPMLEIMAPLIMARRELDLVKERIVAVAEDAMAAAGRRIDYTVGTMIELPRAALRAGEIAQTAEFFSFGTNDLTQTALGISRDDAAMFLGAYVGKGVFARDPFVTLDQDGVGELVAIAAERGRATRPGIKLGICGEHGGDPASIGFCETLGLDYVSCSPYRAPIARLAAAQAGLRGNARREPS